MLGLTSRRLFAAPPATTATATVTTPAKQGHYWPTSTFKNVSLANHVTKRSTNHKNFLAGVTMFSHGPYSGRSPKEEAAALAKLPPDGYTFRQPEQNFPYVVPKNADEMSTGYGTPEQLAKGTPHLFVYQRHHTARVGTRSPLPAHCTRSWETEFSPIEEDQIHPGPRSQNHPFAIGELKNHTGGCFPHEWVFDMQAPCMSGDDLNELMQKGEIKSFSDPGDGAFDNEGDRQLHREFAAQIKKGLPPAPPQVTASDSSGSSSEAGKGAGAFQSQESVQQVIGAAKGAMSSVLGMFKNK